MRGVQIREIVYVYIYVYGRMWIIIVALARIKIYNFWWPFFRFELVTWERE